MGLSGNGDNGEHDGNTDSTVAVGDLVRSSTFAVLLARVSIGLVVLICAELFSGASLKMGFWHPWTLGVTYWLYFGHFFFFTTLAVRTGRTSLPSLYLWGVLYGLYESWITKVIWCGYGGDGKLVLGNIGPYGFAEISMVFLFHPVVSFILPASVACLLCPSLRRVFPDLAWITGKGKWARCVRAFLIVSFAPIMGMNSGGPDNLVLNAVFVVGCLAVCLRLARPAFRNCDGPGIVAFSRWGFAGLCVYLVLLYGTMYFLLRPEGLPSVPVQLLTLVFYAVTVLGLRRHCRATPVPADQARVDEKELKRVAGWFALLLVLALVSSLLAGSPILYIPIVLVFVVWTLGGFVLTAVAFARGGRNGPSSSDQCKSPLNTT